MLKEFIEKIASMADPHIYRVGNDTYTNDRMTRIDPHIDRPETTTLFSLNGIVQAIKVEIDRVHCPIFICVRDSKHVDVFTTYREDNLDRDLLYTAQARLPERLRVWSSYDDAMIILRSRFVQNDGTVYILDLLSKITDENSVSSSDNGLSQTVNAKHGISLASKVSVNPRVKLRPFRTFLEVEQPESEFLLRLRAGGEIGLFEADGGAWELSATHNIAGYFESELSDLINAGSVIVTE